MRVFAAVWPPEEVLDRLDLAVGAVRRQVGVTGPVRWSARETWHLTCAFYGEVPDGRVGELSSALAGVATAAVPYRLALRGAGVFAHRTLWVGVGGDVGAQQALVRAAVAAGEAVGSRPDERTRERAHLTIGRVRAHGSSRRDRRGDARDGFEPEAVVAALAVYEGPAWTVDALRLVASRPGEGRGGGPLYRTVEEFAFGPAGGAVAPWAP